MIDDVILVQPVITVGSPYVCWDELRRGSSIRQLGISSTYLVLVHSITFDFPLIIYYFCLWLLAAGSRKRSHTLTTYRYLRLTTRKTITKITFMLMLCLCICTAIVPLLTVDSGNIASICSCGNLSTEISNTTTINMVGKVKCAKKKHAGKINFELLFAR